VLAGKIPVPAAISQEAALIAGQCREAANARPSLKLVSTP
jgi:hypothetical protein